MGQQLALFAYALPGVQEVIEQAEDIHPEIPIPLPHSLNKGGHTYTLHRKGAKSAIYKQTVIISGKAIMGWETFRIRVAPKRTLPDGSVIPTREIFPSDHDFGRYAWYYMSFDKAMVKFRELEGGEYATA